MNTRRDELRVSVNGCFHVGLVVINRDVTQSLARHEDKSPTGILTEKGAYPYTPLTTTDIVAAVRYVLSTPPSVQVCDIQLRPAAQAF